MADLPSTFCEHCAGAIWERDGIGAVIWALVIGMAVACLLELPDLRTAWHGAATRG